MICGSDDDTEDQNRVQYSECQKAKLRHVGLLRWPALEPLQKSGVVKKGAPDHKGIGKVQAGHGRELVHGLSANPDAFGIALAHGVVEAIRVWKESWRHEWVDTEYQESGEISKCHCPPCGRERRMVLGNIIVPGEESVHLVN